jgi:FtsH-binding integral membrane protein
MLVLRDITALSAAAAAELIVRPQHTGSYMDSPPTEEPQDIERRKRATRRMLYSLYAVFVGLLVMTCFDQYTINGVPARYAAWIFIAFGLLGLLGVNVFWDSPEDKRLDHQSPPSDKGA